MGGQTAAALEQVREGVAAQGRAGPLEAGAMEGLEEMLARQRATLRVVQLELDALASEVTHALEQSTHQMVPDDSITPLPDYQLAEASKPDNPHLVNTTASSSLGNAPLKGNNVVAPSIENEQSLVEVTTS